MKFEVISTCIRVSDKIGYIRKDTKGSFSLEDLQLDKEHVKVHISGEDVTLAKRYMEVTVPETTEDIAFLDKLSHELLGHSKICFVDAWGDGNMGYVLNGEDYQTVKNNYDQLQNRRLFFRVMMSIAQEAGIGVYHIQKNPKHGFQLVRKTKGRTKKVIAKAGDDVALLYHFRREVCHPITLEEGMM